MTRRVPADQYVLLNCPPGERWRQHAETDQDVTSLIAAELEADMARVHELQEEAEGMTDAEFITPGRTAAAKVHLAELVAAITRIYRRAWVRHTRLRDVVVHDSPQAAQELWRLSWIHVALCAVLLERLRDMAQDEKGFDLLNLNALDPKATDYRYAAAIGMARGQLCVTHDPLSKYSPHLVMTTGMLLSEALDAYGWTSSAGEYLHALWLRYACMLARPTALLGLDIGDLGPWAAYRTPPEAPDYQPPNEEEEVEEEEEEEGLGDEFTGSRAGLNEGPRHTERDLLLDPAPLRTAFLDVGERLFFTHLWRDHSLRYTVPLRPPSDEEDEAIRRRAMQAKKALAAWRLQTGLPAMRAFFERAFKAHRDDLLSDLQNLYPERLLLPGEREQFKTVYAAEADSGDAHEVLFRLRYTGYKRMTTTLSFEKPLLYLDAYVARETAIARTILATPDTVELTDDDFYAYVPRKDVAEVDERDIERVLLLLVERIIDRALEERTQGAVRDAFVRAAYVDDRSLEGVRGRPPFDQRIWQAVCRQADDSWPRFMAVWLNYTVGPHGPMDPAMHARHTFRSRHLVDALGAWMALALEGPGSRDLLAQAGLCSSWARLALTPHLFPLPPLATWQRAGTASSPPGS